MQKTPDQPRSKKRPFDIPGQGALLKEDSANSDSVDGPKKNFEYERGTAKKGRPEGCVNSDGLHFRDVGVSVNTIHLGPEGIEGLSPDGYEIIDTCEFRKRYSSTRFSR